jgi:cytochrome c-type biogenesis protein CcmE
MKTYLKFGVLMTLIVGSLVWLALGGISDSKTYYRTIGELQQMGDSAHGKRLRVGGDVERGSILKNGPQTTFVLHQGAQTLKVVYEGTDPLPDTFKDGAQALADGRLGSNGVFEAKKIQAKCASKYEQKPQQKGVSHESPGTKVSELTQKPAVLAQVR